MGICACLCLEHVTVIPDVVASMDTVAEHDRPQC